MPIVCIGEIVVDWLSFEPGETFYTATKWYRALGGNACNVAIGLTRLQSPVRLVGKVGADLPAEFLSRTLEKEGVPCSYIITDAELPTAQCYMTTSQDGEHNYYNWPQPHAADALSLKDIDLTEVLENVSVVHATSISVLAEPRRSTIERTFATAKQQNIILSFDAGYTGSPEARASAQRVLRSAHLVKMNENELHSWTQELAGQSNTPADPSNGTTISSSRTRDCLSKHARWMFDEIQPVVLFVTLGAQGSLIINSTSEMYCPQFPVQTVSTVGAGDAFVAGVLHALTDEFHITTAHQLSELSQNVWKEVGGWGNIAGAYASTHPSAYAGMAMRKQLLAALRTDSDND